MLKRMSDYTYHCGLQLRIYPSDRQKQIIRRNAGASRFVYNKIKHASNDVHLKALFVPEIYICYFN